MSLRSSLLAVLILMPLGIFACSGATDPGLETVAPPDSSDPGGDPGGDPGDGDGEEPLPPPNIVLMMADDMGWGDTGYNGHPELETPNLDAMAAAGARFDRFYAASPVCSPTRGSVLTGRHPYRYDVPTANEGHLKHQEVTLAELLQEEGYATGHFGKWHLGTMTKTLRDSNRGGLPEYERDYSPPWEHGFETVFSTEAKVSTYDPMFDPDTGDLPEVLTRYWVGPGQFINPKSNSLRGDDSNIVAREASNFIEEATTQGKPFFAVVWFHAPHAPIVASPEWLAHYRNKGVTDPNEQHYYGTVSALDAAVGRIRTQLETLGVRDNTMLFFASDNGPENNDFWTRAVGSTGGLRERKRSLHEGGVRVPGILEWPARVPTGTETNEPASTLDYMPTILAATGIPRDRMLTPADGIDLMPIVTGSASRQLAIPFEWPGGGDAPRREAIMEGAFKLISIDNSNNFALYNVASDPAESLNLASFYSERVSRMRADLDAWQLSYLRSQIGADYR